MVSDRKFKEKYRNFIFLYFYLSENDYQSYLGFMTFWKHQNYFYWKEYISISKLKHVKVFKEHLVEKEATVAKFYCP